MILINSFARTTLAEQRGTVNNIIGCVFLSSSLEFYDSFPIGQGETHQVADVVGALEEYYEEFAERAISLLSKCNSCSENVEFLDVATGDGSMTLRIIYVM